MHTEHGMNDHFVPNTVGKTISLDIQPYRHYSGKITKIVPRQVTVTEFMPSKGTCRITYEVFDCTIEVTEGQEVRALYAGIPQGSNDMKGHTEYVSLNFDQLHRGAHQEQTVIIALCG